MKTAAIYLRSSKDRSDVSIDSQRRELQKVAAEKDLQIIREYSDVVESAKDENRPGFQELLRSLKDTHRGWDHLLLVDTSRLSRRRYMAQVFKHEAAKRGIKIIYSKIPETDPIADMVVIGVMEVFDELHSLMSREKGLAGMAENVRQGYRAGGRAPYGYKLRKIETGAIREGEQVNKSKLEPNENSSIISRYLKERAKGKSRNITAASLGLKLSGTTLIGIEWNALTYAGHTVWNVHSEFNDGHGYVGGKKRKQRSEWVTQKNTHPALITDSEAEAILKSLSESRYGKRYKGQNHHLLTGFLKTPDGKSWHTNGPKHYRTRNSQKGRYVDAATLEAAVWQKIIEDSRSSEFISKLTDETRKRRAKDLKDPTLEIRNRVNDINAQVSKMMDLAAKLESPDAAIRKINELEWSRRTLLQEIDRLEREHAASVALATITEDQVRGLLTDLMSVESDKRELLGSLVDTIVLDPITLECRIRYRIAVESRKIMASPRGFDQIPMLRTESLIYVQFGRLTA